ncbi:MAG TPA: glycine C-acetyltransferase [Pirellulaceae bacterium]|nr:glycine C-acetyltransferase [Pirellulaceae bacterium]
MYGNYQEYVNEQLASIRAAGLTKSERIITSPQQPHLRIAPDRPVLNMCANNYLGLADNPEVIAAAHAALDKFGYGMASVRFICGTQSLHKDLERQLATFVGCDDAILYSSCFDANGGLFETLLTAEDAIISDELNHASIIDGVRLCKAQRFRYKNSDMTELETRLKEADAAGARFKMIATDGVFSMDGTIANLPAICDLADKYQALVMVDDSHACGFMGPNGRGTHEYHGVLDRIDIITGTLGKALGGGSGGFTAGKREIVELLRQRSRPYLFSNSLPPPIVAASLKSLEILNRSTELRDRLESNTRYFRDAMTQHGFNIVPGEHPIVPIMLGDAVLAGKMAEMALVEGVYVIGFSFPVVPHGKARIRTQISAAHTLEDLDVAINAFVKVKRELGI